MKLKLSRLSAAVVSTLLIFTFSANSLALANDPIENLREQFLQEAARKKELPPPRYIPNREYDMRHIALDLRFDWEAEQALGTATLTLAPILTNAKTFTFNAALDAGNSVKLVSGPALQ